MKGVIAVDHNGSKWNGQTADPLENLLERLKSYSLSAFSEIEPVSKTVRRYWGNFEELSAGFSIDVKIGSPADNTLGKLFKANWKKSGRRAYFPPTVRFTHWMYSRGGAYAKLRIKHYEDGEPYFSYAAAEMSLSEFLRREQELTGK